MELDFLVPLRAPSQVQLAAGSWWQEPSYNVTALLFCAPQPQGEGQPFKGARDPPPCLTMGLCTAHLWPHWETLSTPPCRIQMWKVSPGEHLSPGLEPGTCGWCCVPPEDAEW